MDTENGDKKCLEAANMKFLKSNQQRDER